MAKALDISLTPETIQKVLGEKEWTILLLRRQIEVLEARVDELDPPTPDEK